MTNELSATFFGLHPGAVIEGWIVADVLTVAAFEHGYPVVDFILSIADDSADHSVVVSDDGPSGSARAMAISRSRTISSVESLHV